MEPRVVKITIVGETAVGKTCLIYTFKDGSYPTGAVQQGAEQYSVNNFTFNGVQLNIQLWDTIGIENDGEVFGPDRLRRLHYADTGSFKAVESRWVPEVKAFSATVPFIIVGTKQDLRQDEALVNTSEERTQTLISRSEGEALAQRLGALAFFECSSLHQSGVNDVFAAALTAFVKKLKGSNQNNDRGCVMM